MQMATTTMMVVYVVPRRPSSPDLALVMDESVPPWLVGPVEPVLLRVVWDGDASDVVVGSSLTVAAGVGEVDVMPPQDVPGEDTGSCLKHVTNTFLS